MVGDVLAALVTSSSPATRGTAWLRGDRERAELLEEVSGVKGYYTVWFTNLTECALGVSDISWCVTVVAGSEADARELGLEDARVLNREFGMPPHSLRVSEAELPRLAWVQFMGYG